jgi:hypothetical protein
MAPDIHKAVEQYVEWMRAIVSPRYDVKEAFLSSAGTNIFSSSINKYIKKARADYERELGRPLGEISTTFLRRSAVAIMRQAMTSQDDQRIVLGVMCHNIAVADKVNDRLGQKEKGQQLTKIVRQALEKRAAKRTW